MARRGPYPDDGPLPDPPAPKAAGEPWGETRVVGKPLPRIDAYERVSGTAVFPRDVALPDMLHAAILRCPHAHARVVAVDASAALAMPGVRAVLTPDSPGADIPWYDGTSRLLDPHCRYEGEEVAAVAAETPQQARDALRAVAVTYETLPFVVEDEAAAKAGAPKVQESGNLVRDPMVYTRGDVDRGFAQADAVFEAAFTTPCEIHTPMEVHGSVARWDGNALTVWDTTQGVFGIQGELAEALKMPLSRVRVIGHYMGGGFGSKLTLGKYTVIAALLARSTARPVKLFLSREETFLCVGNRPANSIRVRIGGRKDGTLTAIDYRSLGAAGAYPTWAGTSFLAADLYLCPNVRTEDATVYINAGQARPFRAPGFPQGAWALEQAMDGLARELGLDPLDLRLKNIPDASQRRGGQPYTSTGLKRCLEEGARAFGWREARARAEDEGVVRRGVGLAAAIWAYGGGPPSTAVVKLYPDGSANLNMGAADIGTGTKTVMAQVVSEELGVPLDRIAIENADTATTEFTGPSGGSKTVPSDAPAVRAAALEVKRQVLEAAATQMEVSAGDLVLSEGRIASSRDPAKHLALADLKVLSEQQVLVGVGKRHANPEGKIANPFSAHFAEVEVNSRTGEVKVLRLLGAHDSGRVMNARTYENQVFGGMTMGIGFAMTEHRVLDRNQTGRMVNANWHDYKIPTMLDVPPQSTCLPVDPHDVECNTTGAKGLGEPATIPTAAALANAIFHATGVRAADTPLNPTRLAGFFDAGPKEG